MTPSRQEVRRDQQRGRRAEKRATSPGVVKAERRAKYEANREQEKARSRAWRESNPEKAKEVACASQRKLRFGVTRVIHGALLYEQGFVCAICSMPEATIRDGKPVSLAVDHDHVTGTVRGLLCNSCNLGLGSFRDDPKRLSSAIEYLKRNEQKGKERKGT